jgi:hypothetical protein
MRQAVYRSLLRANLDQEVISDIRFALNLNQPLGESGDGKGGECNRHASSVLVHGPRLDPVACTLGLLGKKSLG